MDPCAACGAANRASATFCRDCGAPLRRAAPAGTPAGTPGAQPHTGDTQRGESRRLRGWVATFDFDPTGESFTLRAGRNVVGRDPREADIFLGNDPRVSRRHCVVMAREHEVWLRDLDSELGTRVNDQELGTDPVRLNDGDRVQVGSYVLLVKLLPA